jgi:predicted lipid-binding transport protein (Tim44 family)/tellurite resistance protein
MWPLDQRSSRLPLRWGLTLAVFGASAASARIGGGEHFDSGHHGGGGGELGAILDVLVWLVVNAPCVGVPLLVLAVGVFVYQRTRGEESTRKAIDLAEAERRTSTSSVSVANWVGALKSKDPAFDLLTLLDRVRRLFIELQEAWFLRDLEPARRHLSDGAYQRLLTQLGILRRLGLRDAAVDPKVIDLQLIGLEQTPSFDTVHVRVTASMRDTDVPAEASDEEARAAAQQRAPERFVEVWSLVRRPGVRSRTSAEGAQGGCPNCGAPFSGGAANRCEHCSCIVNSGEFDWVVVEITQGGEYAASHEAADGLARARQSDPELATEVLEDRASLLFWRWIEAQVKGDVARLLKLATPEFVGGLQRELGELDAAGRRRIIRDCAVGAAHTRSLTSSGANQLAFIELRWSAKLGTAPRDGRPPTLPSQPQRSALVLQRRAGAVTPSKNGLSTCRCPSCSAPLSDNGQDACEYCGTKLASGDGDWVLSGVLPWEAWTASSDRQDRPAPVAARVPDRSERERLVYLMAALAAADGVIDRRERRLLRMTADRWGVPWSNIELALDVGSGLFTKLMPKGSAEADVFMRELVAMALVDGKVDVNERKMLDAAASHLGMGPRLKELLERASGERQTESG